MAGWMRRAVALVAGGVGVLALSCVTLPRQAGAQTQAQPPQGEVHLRVLGGLATISQYVRFERPFWEHRIREISNGRITAEIAPYDSSGLRAQEVLAMMRLGVVSFGTILLGTAAADEPEFNILDLPVLSPDFAALRRNMTLLRPLVENLLRERHNVEMLGLYTYPAQVLFCQRPFTGLEDLAGRRIRTSSVGQSEIMEALGATAVVIGFAEIVPAIRAGVVECAITGALSGNAIGLHEVTVYVHAMALSWGLSAFGASRGAWDALAPDVQIILRNAIAGLEREIWQGADRETGEGLACNAGLPGCERGTPGNMQIVPVSPADIALRERLLRETVVPRWISRCGVECAESWNRYMQPVTGFRARAD
jgi:TRAP-type C4-dicarboxylate transport system substrate-binding protein